MAIQIGRFSFRGPFANLDEIKNRPGLYIIHTNLEEIVPILINETPQLNDTISKVVQEKGLKLGSNCYVSVYNTFCALQLDREEMVSELYQTFHLEPK
jgi:hypothetical protein